MVNSNSSRVDGQLTGHEYANLVARYLASAYGSRGLVVYREVSIGKSIIGKNRSIDILAVHPQTGQALAVECKYQATAGTADEKIPYALADMDALWIPGVVVWAGEGFSDGVVQMLRGAKRAAWCRPDPTVVSRQPTASPSPQPYSAWTTSASASSNKEVGSHF